MSQGFVFGQNPAQANNVAQGNFRKAAAFGNCTIPRNDGTQMKVGTFKFFSDNKEHVALMELLSTPEGLERFRAALAIDYRVANGENSSGLAI
jgi:hypothetical protein